ncbi:MAG: OmpA family protein [Kofleriaceae bacterium]
MPRLACSIIALCAGAAPVAHAQPAGDFPLDGFRPAIDSRGFFTVNGSDTLGHGELSFGLGSLAWGRRLLAFDAGGASYSVDDVVTATLIAAVGLELGPAKLELGASLPLAILSGDRGPDDAGALDDPNDDRRYQLDGQGLGNLALHVKARLLAGAVGVGAIASVYLPTTNPAQRFLGERSITPQLLGVVDRAFGARRRLRIGINGGIRLRSATSFTDAGFDGAPPTGMTVAAAAELPLGFGLSYAIAPQRFELVGEVFGALPIGVHERYQPLEALAGVKLYLARNSFLSLGAGRGLMPGNASNPDARVFIGIVFEPRPGARDGEQIERDEPDRSERTRVAELNDRDGDQLVDEVDRCPDEPEDFDQFEDADGCPDLDNDHDKLLDVDDLCPNDPEDQDGFEDEDGCPDLDNDKDRIVDTLDRCPNDKEVYNNVDDGDGCPDTGVVIETETTLDPLRPINFEYNKDVIKPDSYYILDAVIAMLQGNPDILRLEVAGHTDERGDDAYNLDLSNRRAAAVVEYLTTHGSKLDPRPIDPKRLESWGYGETRPIDRSSGPKAWAKNRRVEFLILKRAP